jgi:hypothetical protein
MEKQLIEEISDGVATLPFNRPDRLRTTPMTYIRPRCGAKNRRGTRCGMNPEPNERYCRYHLGD